MDRMNFEMSGYTVEEKIEIAKGIWLPKQADEHGVDGDRGSDGALDGIISGYRKAGRTPNGAADCSLARSSIKEPI